MATLREYFQKDIRTFTVHKDFPAVNRETGEVLYTMVGKLHYDFDARAYYVSIYIPETDKAGCPALVALHFLHEIVKLKDNIYIATSLPGEEKTDVNDLVFTGRIFLYDENTISDENRDVIEKGSKAAGQDVRFRDTQYAKERSKVEKPLAFISHDSADKELIAKPIAIGLQKLLCPVWYDEFSLVVGDSLRESIEKGLRECKKCILVLSENFLANKGWGKRESDSIFTRELIEKNNVILPVWHNVSAKDIYEYSPSLADRVGLNWQLGEEKVVSKLYQAIKC